MPSIRIQLHSIRSAVPFLAFATLLLSLPAHSQSTLSQNQDGFNGARMDGFMDSGPDKDSTVIERNVSHDYWQWTIDPNSGLVQKIEPDTLHHAFHNVHFTQGMDGSYSHLGNMGSPRLSRLYFQRERFQDFMFTAPLDYWLKAPMDFRFTDTKTPHLALDYYKAGDKRTGEERIKGYFAANFNKKAGIGLDADYLIGRGRYDNQSTSMFDARLYTYYRGDNYTMHVSAGKDNIKIAENGGIQDVRYVTNPESMAEGRKQYSPEDIPFRMYDNWNNIRQEQILFNQSLALNDSWQQTDSIGDTITTYTATKQIGTLAHSAEINALKRRYISYYVPAGFYARQFLDNDSVDKARNLAVTNTVSLSLLEGSTQWAFAGLTGFVRHTLQTFSMPDTTQSGNEYFKRTSRSDLQVGAQMEKSKGENLTFKAAFQTSIAGDYVGDLSLDADVTLRHKLFGKEASLGANFNFSSESSAFFLENFHSTYAWWDCSFDREIRTHIGAFADIEKTSTRLELDLENVAGYIYLQNTGAAYVNGDGVTQPMYDITARQHEGSIQILSARLIQNFKLGPLHWDNTVTWQTSSDKDIIPLPDLNVYSDLYFKFIYAKRLNMEIGANATYFTRYTAPGYCPAVGMYHLQSPDCVQQVGDYPIISGYVNCSLRGVRFYVMYSHVNDGLLNTTNSFFIPGYPSNPGMVNFGLSWTFFD